MAIAAQSEKSSLHWRLPLSISGLVAVVLALVVFLAYRQVTATLVTSGATRAQTAADQLVNVIAQPLQQGIGALSQTVRDPDLVQYLQHPTADDLEAVRQKLTPLTAAGPRRVEIWNDRQTLLFEITNAKTASGTTPSVDFPASSPPYRPGVGPLQVVHDTLFGEVVAAIQPPSDPVNAVSPSLGYLVVRTTLVVNPPGIINRLVGADAVVAIGNQTGGAWFDFSHAVPAPGVNLSQAGVTEDSGSGGDRQVGALAVIRGTPWSIWVAFPRAVIVAPARSFLIRMSMIGLVVTALAAVLVRRITFRLTRPLGELTEAAGAIAAGDYARRVATDRPDEIGQLGSAFNAMAEHIGQDITGRAVAEAALQDAEERMRFALESSQVGIWDAEMATGRARWSNVLEGLHGLVPGTFKGSLEAFMSHIDPDDRDHVRAAMEQATRDDVEIRLLYRAVWPDRSIHWIRSTGRVFRDADGTPLHAAGVAMDVTAARTLEDQLSQAQKMEAIGQLAGGVAHDFNNLLTAILGYGFVVLDSLEASDPRRGDVTEIIGAGQRAAELTKQLLAFSRKQVLQPKHVNLNALVSRTSSLLRRLIGEHIQLVTALNPDVGTVKADPGQIEQIIINLAVNARDAMPDGGRLLIETSNVELDDTYVYGHASVRPGPYVMIAVSDQGIGMDDATKRRLFEPFFTTKEQGKGTGLGLATVYGIVKQSGGYIWVYSEPDHGATFKVYFPRAEGEADRIAPAEVADPAPSGSETVMLVEDERAVRYLTRIILERAGYTVIEAANPEEALTVFRNHIRDIDLVITDVVMPGSTGPALFQALLPQRPTLRVLYMSGYTSEAIVREGQLNIGESFLPKPFTADALTRRVRQLLDHKTPV